VFFRNDKKREGTWVDFAELRRIAPLSLILSHYGLDAELKRVGSSERLCGCCPIHKGSNPEQFVVDLQKNVWRCFGDCNRGGGSLELVAEIEHLALRDAAVLISQWNSVAPQDCTRGHSHQQKGHQAMSGKPSHKVFVVEDKAVAEGEEPNAFWTRIGSAWPHKDGKGLNLVLSALPTNSRLVLREYTEKDEKADNEKVAKFRKK
jgi:CHC2-type zinc finger protein